MDPHAINEGLLEDNGEQSELLRPTRLLVVLPSWVGDAVMATPSLRVLRELLPGAYIGALVRPGIDEILRGFTGFDEVHVDRAAGVMGPKRVAARLRPSRYDAALLLTNSFSTALTTRIAGIPRRIGYDRDGRGFLLTHRVRPLRRCEVAPYSDSPTAPNAWAPVPACEYYFELTRRFLRHIGIDAGEMGPLELVVTREEHLAAAELLEAGGIAMEDQRLTPLAMLNPGANDAAKRWPPDRFAAVADYLARHYGMTILLNGAPGERAVVDSVASLCEPGTRTLQLPKLGISLGSLKAIISRCRVVLTNDTGPRHIAAALGVPVVSLFGPTDRRWTTIPFSDEVELVADPGLPVHEVANDHPERCQISRIGVGDAVAAVNRLLSRAAVRRVP